MVEEEEVEESSNPQKISLPPPNRKSIFSSSIFFSFPRPDLRVTSEFDSERSAFLHKVSCRFFGRLAKLKLSFQNNRDCLISHPRLGFLTEHLSVLYDVESRNALIKGFFGVGNLLQLRATQDVKSGQIGERNYFAVCCSTKFFSMACACDNRNSIASNICLGNMFLFKYDRKEEQKGEMSITACLPDPSYKLVLSSSLPSIGLPKATFRFPLGEVSLEAKEDEEAKRVLSIHGILKGQILNGICTLRYRDNDLNLRYTYKDEEMTFIPSISLPSNALSFAFKRRFSPSDKLSYWYYFKSNVWSVVYKRNVDKDVKFKAGYDSDVRHGWAALWVGNKDGNAKTAPKKMMAQFMIQVPQDDNRNPILMFQVGNEDGKAKTAPKKTMAQFMIQVPQDNNRNPILMFRVKKRWDF